MYDYDLFVIGAGSAGVRAARMSGQFGARVGIAEDRYLGGTCVNVGCVPKKLFVYASHYSEDFRDAMHYGWDVRAEPFDWPRLRDNKDREIERLNGIYANLLEKTGCDLHEGRATLVDAHTVEIAGRQFTAEHILVATGGWPFVPDIDGREHAITSNEIFFLDELPGHAVVVGGGYISVEFACILHGLGVAVDLIYRGPLFLRGFDDDVREFVASQLRAKDINLHFECTVDSIVRQADDSLAITTTGGPALTAGMVLYATGRKPNSSGINLEAIGVAMDDDGAVLVDDHYRTSVPSVYAMGDVTNRVQLTPVATAEGTAFARTLFGGNPSAVDYELIPSAVFTQPPIGTVGLTEAEARERGHDVEIYRSEFKTLKHTLTDSSERTLLKLVVDKTSDKVLGVHMVGPEAGEVIQGFAVALRAGATKSVFDSTIGIHPTTAEEFVTMREPVA